MSRKLVLFAAIAILAVHASHAVIEVTAGAAKDYESPLILTADLPTVDETKWGQGVWETSPDMKRLSQYVCDKVYVKDIQVAVDPTKKGNARVSFKGQLAAKAGHDKTANLTFELLNGDEVVGRVSKDVAVEEEKTANWKVSLEVPAAAMRADLGAKLRITMDVEDD